MPNRYTVAPLTPEEREERRKAVQRAISKRYAQRHPERVKARRQRYHATKGITPEAREKAKEKASASYYARRDTILAESKAKLAALSPEEREEWRAYRREVHRRWRERNREKERTRLATYHKEHREDSRLRGIAYRQTTTYKVRTSSEGWKAARRNGRQINDANREARKKSLPAQFAKSDRDAMMHYWHFACAVCGNEEGFQWTIVADHWVPLASPDCPGTIPTNMVPLCHGIGGCNNSKQDRDPDQWLVKRYGRRKATRIQKAIAAYFATKLLIYKG